MLRNSQKINLNVSLPPKTSALKRTFQEAQKEDRRVATTQKDQADRKKLKVTFNISSGNTISYRQGLRDKRLSGSAMEAKKLYAVSESYNRNLTTYIETKDYETLADGQWINTHVVEYTMDEFMKRYRETSIGEADELIILPMHVFSRVFNSRGKSKPETVLTKTGKSMFDFDFIAVPIFHVNHYFLTIMAYLPDLVNASESPRTTIFVLDSLGQKYDTHITWLKAMFARMAISHRPTLSDIQQHFKTIPAHYVNVPIQPNFCDCGLYPAHFLSVFMSDAHRFYRHCNGTELIEGEVSKIWHAEEVRGRREELRRRLQHSAMVLEELQEWEGLVGRVKQKRGCSNKEVLVSAPTE
ncbi:hypothetical protein FRC03_010008 [Tulasnella sp. 419]|nr:hypothetical protein FRC02_008844 [Tulasnella sp. 418]KAG8957564.1 hypothetical protein FRC03_010008 [Tulasnella sp. 419]